MFALGLILCWVGPGSNCGPPYQIQPQLPLNQLTISDRINTFNQFVTPLFQNFGPFSLLFLSQNFDSFKKLRYN
jgi:hypothetical protein